MTQDFSGGFDFTQAELHDSAAFAAKVEAARVVMVNALAAVGKPINVWTSGHCVLKVQAGTEERCSTCGQLLTSSQVSVEA